MSQRLRTSLCSDVSNINPAAWAELGLTASLTASQNSETYLEGPSMDLSMNSRHAESGPFWDIDEGVSSCAATNSSG